MKVTANMSLKMSSILPQDSDLLKAQKILIKYTQKK